MGTDELLRQRERGRDRVTPCDLTFRLGRAGIGNNPSRSSNTKLKQLSHFELFRPRTKVTLN